jgi:hypothetical protein
VSLLSLPELCSPGTLGPAMNTHLSKNLGNKGLELDLVVEHLPHMCKVMVPSPAQPKKTPKTLGKDYFPQSARTQP